MRKLLCLIIILKLINQCVASEPDSKNYNEQKDLIDGQADKISISADGKLSLTPQIKKVFSSHQPFLWDVVADAKNNLFVATGDGAKIFRIAADGKVDSLAHWSDSEVYALAADNKGVLHAALSPGGKIYRFGKNGQPELLVDLKVAYVWDLLFDGNNTCYAATGDSGRIYKIETGGNAVVFFSTDETHLRCLTWDLERNLLAGSYKNGYIYRINQQGKGTIVYDSDFEEINRLHVDSEATIYAAAMNSSEKISPPSERKDKAPEIQSDFNPDEIMAFSVAPAKRKAQANSGILKIQPNGVVKDLWNNAKDKVYSICLVEDIILAGTGEQGRLFSINKEAEATFVLKLPESQLLALLPGQGEKIWLGATNLCAVYLLEKIYEKSGTFISPVIDADTKTKWGTIQWEERLEAGDKIQFYTRSGNTKEPNATWHAWQAIGEQKLQGVINSAEARFLQWKVELSSKNQQRSPEVSKIKVTYLQQNLPPEISSITIHPIQTKTTTRSTAAMPVDYPAVSISALPDTDDPLAKTMLQPAPYQRPLTNGYRRVSWQANDDNKDQLTFSIFFKFKEDSHWLLLKDELTRSTYTWDSQLMPDGIYQLKVVARDEKSNPINTALTAEKVSDGFVIDNTAPELGKIAIQKMTGDSLQISFVVNDKWSTIKKVEFSVDAQKWLGIYPVDLVCDTKSENFNFKLKLLKAENEILVVKATDESENVGYGYTKIGE